MFDPYRIIGWAWMAVGAVWIATALTSKRSVRRQAIRSRLFQLCLALLAALFIAGVGPWQAILRRQVVAKSPASAMIALVLTLGGLAFALWARYVIGRNWSGTVTVKQDHELVRSGPYAIVRHPIYTGFLVALLGTCIARGTIGAFIGLPIVVVALRLKSLTEESFMTEQFGSQYTNYKSEVKALVPFVW